MAGHRQAHGTPRRDQVRARRNRARVAAAQTAEDQLAAAYDWFRMAARRVADTAERSRRMRDVSEFLARMAAEMERGPDDYDK